ncbi:MAG: CAP domain-containing protein [Clostridium sp.]|nr:CAP domain-containing protein [Clostridium sp.]
MKNKKLLVIIALLLVAGIAFFALNRGPKGEKAIDDTAVARSQEEEGDIHYIDDGAIALAGAAASTNTAGEAQATLALVNNQRAAGGLGGLTWNDALANAAQVRAQECKDKFSHQRPNGTDWWTVDSSIMFGENLAKNYFDANTVVQAWMDSPSHRENIMNGKFMTVGVAAYQAPDGSWYWAQAFGY